MSRFRQFNGVENRASVALINSERDYSVRMAVGDVGYLRTSGRAGLTRAFTC